MYEPLENPCESNSHYLIVRPKIQRRGEKAEKYPGPIKSRTHGPFPTEKEATQKLNELLIEGTSAAKHLGVWASGHCAG